MTEFETSQKIHRTKFNELELPNYPRLDSYFKILDEIATLTYEINEAHFPSKLKPYAEALKHIDPHEGFLVYMTILSALEGTEVSETVEDIRKPDVDYLHLLEEQADVFIRAMNAIQAGLKYTIQNNLIPADTTLSSIVKAKIAKNIERPQKHGGKRF